MIASSVVLLVTLLLLFLGISCFATCFEYCYLHSFILHHGFFSSTTTLPFLWVNVQEGWCSSATLQEEGWETQHSQFLAPKTLQKTVNKARCRKCKKHLVRLETHLRNSPTCKDASSPPCLITSSQQVL